MSEPSQVKSQLVVVPKVGPKLPPAGLAVASLAAVIAAGDHAGAASGRTERPVASVESRIAGEPVEPLMAIVSLGNQRITVYDANGWILRAPVSSGQKVRETPAGVFSVIEKQAEHYSNLYDDAYMPHMQRITPGRALRFTVALSRDIQRRTAVSGCPTTSPNACST